jgi:UrcA family protein
MKKTVLGVAAVLLTYSCLPAQASEVLAQSSVEVRVGDLDLAKASDMSTLYGRLRIAAREVCSDVDRSGSIIDSLVYRECVHSAVHDAVTKLDNPNFTAFVTQRTSPVRARIASN